MCGRFYYQPLGQTHAGYVVPIPGGWMLLRKEFIMAEDRPDMTAAHNESECSLGDLAAVGVLPYSPRRGGVSPINITTPGARVIVYFPGFIPPLDPI